MFGKKDFNYNSFLSNIIDRFFYFYVEGYIQNRKSMFLCYIDKEIRK